MLGPQWALACSFWLRAWNHQFVKIQGGQKAIQNVAIDQAGLHVRPKAKGWKEPRGLRHRCSSRPKCAETNTNSKANRLTPLRQSSSAKSIS